MKHRLQTAQKRVIRLILNLPMRSHLDISHCETIGWLKVEDRVSQIPLLKMTKSLVGFKLALKKWLSQNVRFGW